MQTHSRKSKGITGIRPRYNLYACVLNPFKTHHGLAENLSPLFKPHAEFAADFGNYTSPLVFDDGTTVKTPTDWSRRRREMLSTWEDFMGSWPPLIEKPSVQYLSEQRRENFTQHRVSVEIAPDQQTVDGYILIPDGEGPFPAVLVVYYDAETGTT